MRAQAFQQIARESLVSRGLDPEMFPSLARGLDLGGDESKRAQAAGVSVEQWQGATPDQRRQLASSSGTALVKRRARRQELLEAGYSDEQINLWTEVHRRARERVPEDTPSKHDESTVPLSQRYEPLYDKAVEDVIKDLGWNEAKLLSDDNGGFLGFFGGILGLPDTINDFAVEKLGDLGFYEEDEVRQFQERRAEGEASVWAPFEEGAEAIRPVSEQILKGVAEPFEQGEMGFEAISGIRSRGVSGAIKGEVATDILSDVINPAAIAMVTPFAMQGIRAGMSTKMVAAKLVDNLVGTGMTPELAQGSLRVLSAAGRRGFKVGQVTKARLGNLPEGWVELPPPAELPEAAQARTQAGGIELTASADKEGNVWVDILSAAERPTAPDMFDAFREVGRLVAANPERTFRAKVVNERLASILRRAGIREVPGELPEFLRGIPEGEEAAALERLGQIAPTFEFGLDDIARFFPQEAAEAGAVLPKARPSFQQFQKHHDEMGQAVERAKKSTEYIREEVALGRMERGALDEATVRLADARRDLRTARRDLATARYKNAREEILAAAKDAGASDQAIKILGEAFDNSVRLVPSEELLLNAGGTRHWLANAVAHITGTPPGVVGRLAHHRDILLSALRRNSFESTKRVFKETYDLLRAEKAAIRFVGPKKWAKLAEGEYKLYHIVQHPEWFDGMSPELRKAMEASQGEMRKRLETAKALGYPIEALEGSYLEQLWEVPHASVGAAYLPGRVSVAKPRLFDDYFTGLTQGYVPKPMSVEELMHHSTGLLDQAIADAWMKQEVVRRFGTRHPGKVAAGRKAFDHALYKGWNAPNDVVDWLQEMEQPIGRRMRQASNISARFRGTVFGLADIAVTGVQLPLSLAHGGIPGMMGALNRSLQQLNLPHFHLYMDDQEFLGRATRAMADGLHIGLGPSAIQMRGGTLIGYFPGMNWLEKPVSKAIDVAAQAQFGHALSHVRLRMYEGNLIALRLTGNNINDPAVRRMAAEWANSATGASRGAMVKGRRTVESIALTSTQMTRANLSVYGQLIKSLGPAAGKMERLRAALTLVNIGAYVYGIQWLFNRQFGEGPMEWVPGRSNWGTIRVGSRTVPIIPQRSVLRGIDKSVKILSEEVGLTDTDRYSIEDVLMAWSQVAVGKANPMVQAPLAAAGYGFEPETGKFEMGTLSAEGKLVGMAPFPPLVEQAGWQERDELSLAIAGLGFNPYATSSGTLLREEFKTKTEEELNWESPAHQETVSKDKRFHALWERSIKESAEYGSESAMTSIEVRQEIGEGEVTKGVVALAESVQDGDPIATGNWSEKRKEFLIWKSGKWDERLTGGDPRTEIGRLVEEYYSISPDSEKYTDSSGVTDWAAFTAAREEVLDRMPEADANAIRDKEKFQNPVAEAVDKQFRDAQDKLQTFWQVEDEVWGKMRNMSDVVRPYATFEDFRDTKVQELLNKGYPREDIPWLLNRMPILSEISNIISEERFNYRLAHPEADALLVKWYGNTPARVQVATR
jgi:hypothetical protein